MPPFASGFQGPWALPGIPRASVEEDVILILTSISDGGFIHLFLSRYVCCFIPYVPSTSQMSPKTHMYKPSIACEAEEEELIPLLPFQHCRCSCLSERCYNRQTLAVPRVQFQCSRSPFALGCGIT